MRKLLAQLGPARQAGELALYVKLAPFAAAALFLFIVLAAAVGGTQMATSSAACGPGEPQLAGTVEGLPKRAQKYAPGYLAAAKRFELGPRGPAILAGVHSVESDFGRLNDVTSSAGAQGHFQFLPSSWAIFGVDGDENGTKDQFDFDDAVMGAANHLLQSGGGDSSAPNFWHDALFGYNHAEWYVSDVLAAAARLGDIGDAALATTTDCEEPAGQGPAELQKSIRLYEPRSYKMLPRSVMAAGRAPQPIDERIWAASVWFLKEYEIAVTAAREAGHASHGDGTSLDMVPANGTALADWKRSTERFARDIGWTPGCGGSCSPPVIDAPEWVRWIGYNGAASHGDPAHCSGGCPAHLHVSFSNDDGSEGLLVEPDQWVMTFPAPGGPSQ